MVSSGSSRDEHNFFSHFYFELLRVYNINHLFVQVWVYENISSLSGRVSNEVNQDVVPCILQWKCGHSIAWNVLERQIFQSTIVSDNYRNFP